MENKKKKMSLRGMIKLGSWTFFGTLGCLAISMFFNWFSFRDYGIEAQRQGMISAIVLPIVLAGPLFFYLTKKMRELAIANHKLALLAATDSLTACLNRGAFSARVDGWLEMTGDESKFSNGALLVIDADHFKKINDSYGHDQGDEALKIISKAIQSSVRSGDLVGRLGGEEFGVFLPGASPESANEVAERLRQSINSTPFQPKGKRHALSVSVGCATFVKPIDFSELFRAADERLYQAKNSGRNRVLSAHINGGQSAPQLAAALH